MNENMQENQNAVAVIGMSGRFPKAKNVDEFWQNLRDGVCSIVFFSDEEAMASGLDSAFLSNPKFVKAYGVLDDIEMFDASFFNMSPREARVLDPQHRLFLECAWEALENAGYDSEKYDGRIGVYAGAGISTYLMRNLLPSNKFSFLTAERLEMVLTNDKDLIPLRVSFALNLTGPSVNINTTCSTSLVATHLACQSLLTYECDMVLTGGCYIRVPQKEGYLHQEGTINSPDGYIRTFDAKAKGMVVGNGVGVLILKRLEEALDDGDYIYALIKGSAINNNGATKLGFVAPSVAGQANATAEAISIAGIDSDSISYVEAHGTATELGDPIEFASLNKAFRATAVDPDKQKKHFCGLGSVKTNIGHTIHAAGICGLIKTVLSLKHKMLPPSLHFETPNPKLDFENSPFYVNTSLQEWKTENGAPRRALVNSFGIGGTNAHVIVEEAPVLEPSGQSRPWQLLLLSTKTSSALETASTNLAQHLKQHPELNLADVAYTLQIGRRDLNYRRMLVCQTVDDAAAVLSALEPKRVLSALVSSSEEKPIIFMFSGQGSQYVNMTKELYEVEATFRTHIDQCSEYLKPQLGLDLRELLYPNPENTAAAEQQLQQTAITQPALFVIEYALAQLWMEWGIQPKAMIGHSSGEYVAACLAGVFSLEDALFLVAKRGEMMQSMPEGDMLAIPLPAQELEPLLGNNLSIAVINGPKISVVAGHTNAVETLQQQLTEQGVECSRLHTSHAFHSEMMEPIIGPFMELVNQVKLTEPQIPYLSNVTGTWITAQEATDPSYWSRHLRQTVRFSDGLEHLLQEPEQILLEIGPGRTLSTLAKQHPAKEAKQVVLTSVRHPKENQSDIAFLLTTVGKLWLGGGKINWHGFYTHEHRHRLPLPTYPFERQYYWIAAPKRSATTNQVSEPQTSMPDLEEKLLETQATPQKNFSSYTAPRDAKEQKIADIWQTTLGVKQIGIHDDFFELGGSSLIAIQLVAKLSEALQTELSVQSFLNAPTIAELAEIIDTPVSSAASTTPTMPPSLVRLQKGNQQKTPLFLVHPIDGQVFSYQELINSFDSERPIYGLQAAGLAGEMEPLTQLTAMATHYIEAIRTVQPNGPYLLGGFSFGGLVAFEMSQQLRCLGQEVALLFMVDTQAVDQVLFNLEDDTAILLFLAEHLLKLNKETIAIDELRGLILNEQINHLLAQQQISTNISVSQLSQMVRVIKANNTAMLNYSPRPYPGRLIFFRAKEPWNPAQPYYPEQFWLDFVNESIEINVVPGNHMTMTNQPHVQIISKRLEQGLKRVELGVG